MNFPHRYRQIVAWLNKKNLKQKEIVRFDMEESDLFNLDIGKRGGDFFLGYFSPDGIKIALEKYGLYAELKNLGFKEILTRIDTSDPYKHKISVYYDETKQKNLLIELVLRKSFFRLNMPFKYASNGKCFQCLSIDWLAMQNPRAAFTPRRPRLPGQKFPGLGMSALAVELLMIICWRLKVAALVNFPGHYHNAVLYSKIFYYLDPVLQARFLALKKTFRNMPLEKISWGIDGGCVTDLRSGQVFEWMTGEQLVPVEDTLKKLFCGKKYKKYVNAKMKEFKFEFNENKYQELKKVMTIKNMEKII